MKRGSGPEMTPSRSVKGLEPDTLHELGEAARALITIIRRQRGTTGQELAEHSRHIWNIRYVNNSFWAPSPPMQLFNGRALDPSKVGLPNIYPQGAGCDTRGKQLGFRVGPWWLGFPVAPTSSVARLAIANKPDTLRQRPITRLALSTGGVATLLRPGVSLVTINPSPLGQYSIDPDNSDPVVGKNYLPASYQRALSHAGFMLKVTGMTFDAAPPAANMQKLGELHQEWGAMIVGTDAPASVPSPTAPGAWWTADIGALLNGQPLLPKPESTASN